MTMQPEDLLSLRTALGLTQGQMAQRLGLTTQFIGMMERSERAIERRTELAARHVFNEEARPWGEMDRGEYADDVPILSAMVLWREEGTPRIKVVGHPEGDDRDFPSSCGACTQGWEQGGTVGALLRLLSYIPYWIMEEGMSPREVHDALWVIPEYRQSVAYEFAIEKGVEQ